ncbi:MAG: hypothetical protein EPN57_08695 [Paraburkholderia sp.]|nr:MAG: hypothetical protein EPN57_08695 [Paraburkholderia sp.]
MAKKPKKDKSSDSPQKTEPWADAHPRVTVGFTTQFPEDLHMKMVWLTDNVPKLSIQKIVQEATVQYVEKLLKERNRL